MAANPESWRTEPFGELVQIPYRAEFTDAELERLHAGFIPTGAEDKWFVYFADPSLFVHRSGTGEGAYRIDLAPGGDRMAVAAAFCASDFLKDSEPAYHAKLLAYIVTRLLLGRDMAFPTPPSIRRAQAAEPPSLDIRSTLQLSFRLVRSEWRWIVLFLALFGVAPEVGSTFFLHNHYSRSSHDLIAFVIYACEAAALSMAGYFWPLTVTALSVQPESERSPSRAVVNALVSAFILLPLWIISNPLLFFYYWRNWSDWMPKVTPGYNIAMTGIWISFLSLIIQLSIFIGIGVITSVILAERGTFVGSVRRAWTLMNGSRWKILALGLLVNAAPYTASLILPFWGRALRGSPAAVPVSWAVFVLERGFDALWAVVVAAIYLELRRVREGVVPGDVAHVFA